MSPGVVWPNGARTAVSLTFDVDAESIWLGRDPKNARRPGVLSQGKYSPDVAVPAILDLLAHEQIPATFFVPGLDADAHPETVRTIHRAGHEVAHHGYEHVRADPGDRAAEEASLLRGIASLERLTGERPVGFRSPSWDLSPHTLELLQREAFRYSSNLMDAVHPYVHPGTRIVELPVQWMLDDAPFFLFGLGENQRPIMPASHALEVWKEEFAGLYEWGAPCVLTFHPQLIGRPSRLRALADLIAFIKAFEGVWFATCRDIADLALVQLG